MRVYMHYIRYVHINEVRSSVKRRVASTREIYIYVSYCAQDSTCTVPQRFCCSSTTSSPCYLPHPHVWLLPLFGTVSIECPRWNWR